MTRDMALSKIDPTLAWRTGATWWETEEEAVASIASVDGELLSVEPHFLGVRMALMDGRRMEAKQRSALESAAWKATHKDFRTTKMPGGRFIMLLDTSGGTALVPLASVPTVRLWELVCPGYEALAMQWRRVGLPGVPRRELDRTVGVAVERWGMRVYYRPSAAASVLRLGGVHKITFERTPRLPDAKEASLANEEIAREALRMDLEDPLVRLEPLSLSLSTEGAE